MAGVIHREEVDFGLKAGADASSIYREAGQAFWNVRFGMEGFRLPNVHYITAL